MNRGKSSISKASSYEEMGNFWDSHDLSDTWNKTEEVKFDVNIKSERTYYAVDNILSERLHSIAKERGVSADTLVNLWIQEKLQEKKQGTKHSSHAPKH